jgi:hypothetical protein
MTTTTSGSSNIKWGWNTEDSTESIAVRKSIDTLKKEIKYSYGTGTNQFQEVVASVNTVTPSTTDASFDLSSIANVINDTIAFTKIRAIMVENTTATTGHDLTVGGAAANPWTAPFNGSGTLKNLIEPNGKWIMESPVDGLVVTNNSSDILLVAHAAGAGDITFNIVIFGITS